MFDALARHQRVSSPLLALNVSRDVVQQVPHCVHRQAVGGKVCQWPSIPSQPHPHAVASHGLLEHHALVHHAQRAQRVKPPSRLQQGSGVGLRCNVPPGRGWGTQQSRPGWLTLCGLVATCVHVRVCIKGTALLSGSSTVHTTRKGKYVQREYMHTNHFM